MCDEAVCGRVVVCDKVGNKAVFERAEEDDEEEEAAGRPGRSYQSLGF